MSTEHDAPLVRSDLIGGDPYVRPDGAPHDEPKPAGVYLVYGARPQRSGESGQLRRSDRVSRRAQVPVTGRRGDWSGRRQAQRRWLIARWAVAAVSLLVSTATGYGWSQYQDLLNGIGRSQAIRVDAPKSAGGDTKQLVAAGVTDQATVEQQAATPAGVKSSTRLPSSWEACLSTTSWRSPWWPFTNSPR
jgi:hypothetical protein